MFAPIDNAGARTTLTRAEAPVLSYPIDPFLGVAASVGNAARAVDENRVDQYAEHYSLTIQQALPWRLTTQIGYLGNQAHHLLDRNNVNNIDPATGSRPLPQFGRVDIKSSGSSANFNGLQFSLYRRASARPAARDAVHVVARFRRGISRRRRIDRHPECRLPLLRVRPRPTRTSVTR